MRKTFTIALCSLALSVLAQEEPATDIMKDKVIDLEGKIAAMEEPFIETSNTVSKLAKFKFSGYVQTQFRHVMDTSGAVDANGKYLASVGDYSGGKFADGTYDVFHVRRGRLKLTYQEKLSRAVLQFDVTQSGVGMKDAYLQITEPWAEAITAKMGVFDRPFGHEIGYSSSSRETPERSRIFQVLFPGERDVGAQLELAAPEIYGALSNLNIKAGLFNGVGIAVENNSTKDFIGRIGYSQPIYAANISLEGGVSAYLGSVVNTDTTRASVIRNAANTADSIILTRGFSYEMDGKAFKKSDSTGMLNKEYDRKYIGFDLRVTADIPVIGGLALRTEYISGTQPGTSSSSNFYNQGRNSGSAVYLRPFSGYYVTYIQNLGLKNQLAIKYDVYDPNTAVSAADFVYDNATKKFENGLSTADAAYSTLGLGLIHHWDANLKFVLYYDMVSNEKLTDASVSGNSSRAVKMWSEDFNDDVLTFRVQYKF